MRHYFTETDTKAPDSVYLCQVSEDIACAACCGLYNVADASRESLTAMLIRRTELFAQTPRNIDDILDFKEKIEAEECQERPFPEFHHCPYIGLAGEKYSRPGCLLHPLARGNNGTDFRGLSFYGGMACRIYFCPSCRSLPKVYKEIVREISQDWYLYGLVMTEKEMLKAFFGEIKNRLGHPLEISDIIGNENREQIVREFLNLKISWQFRPRASAGPANYFFEDQLYLKPRVNYEAAGVSNSRYDAIFRELKSEFDSAGDLHSAESLLDALFDRL
jgi:hypothetical protein